MKAFLDTNVWISSFLSLGNCRELTNRCLVRHQVLVSEWLLQEIFSVLRDKLALAETGCDVALRLIRQNTRLVMEAPMKSKVSRDPDDDHVLAAALGGKADCIISGDDDLLELKSYAGIPIISPHAFWKFKQEFTNC